MTIIIYLTEDKKNYHVIRPKTDSKDSRENFDGRVSKLVEHVTHSDLDKHIKNYYKFEVIN